MTSLHTSIVHRGFLSRPLLVAAAVLSLAGVCACTTTGDPTQGGLFGWSRTKAEERQAKLQRTAENAVQAADQQSAQNISLLQTQTTLQTETQSRQAELDALLAENARLERDLVEATKRSNQRTSNLIEARKELAANREMLASLKSKAHPPLTAPVGESAASKIAQQNERLLKLIRLLSER